jgi:hypothetical protein
MPTTGTSVLGDRDVAVPVAPCAEAQADGVPCEEIRGDCEDCGRREPPPGPVVAGDCVSGAVDRR